MMVVDVPGAGHFPVAVFSLAMDNSCSLSPWKLALFYKAQIPCQVGQ